MNRGVNPRADVGRSAPLFTPRSTPASERASSRGGLGEPAPAQRLCASLRGAGLSLRAVMMLAGFWARFDRLEARVAEQRLIGVGLGVARGEQLVAVEDGVGARHEAQELRFAAEALTSGAQAHH